MGRRASERVGQLTLDVRSALRDELPIVGALRVGGALSVERDVQKDALVNVVVSDAEGVVLARAVGVCVSVTLKTRRSQSGAWVERAHAIALSESEA